MELPEMLRGNSLKRLLQGVAIGFVLTVVVGFSWFGQGFGWYTGDGARQLAQTRSVEAVVVALAPICVDRFRQSATADAVLAELNKAESWSRRGVFEKTGFAKFTGSPNSEREIADACMDVLLKKA